MNYIYTDFYSYLNTNVVKKKTRVVKKKKVQ